MPKTGNPKTGKIDERKRCVRAWNWKSSKRARGLKKGKFNMIRFYQVKTLEYPHKKRAGVKKLPLAAFALGALILGACSTASDVAQVFLSLIHI